MKQNNLQLLTVNMIRMIELQEPSFLHNLKLVQRQICQSTFFLISKAALLQPNENGNEQAVFTPNLLSLSKYT